MAAGLDQKFALLAGRPATAEEMRRLVAVQAGFDLAADDPTIALFIAEMLATDGIKKAADQAASKLHSAVDRARDPLAERAAAELTKQLQQQLNKEAGGILRQLAAQAAQAAPALVATRGLLAAGIIGLVLMVAVLAGWAGLTIGAGGSVSSPFFKAYVEAGNDPSALVPPANCQPSGSGSCWVSIRRSATSPVIPAEGSSPVALLPPAVQVAGLIALIIGFLASAWTAWRQGGWPWAAGAAVLLASALGLMSLLPPSAWSVAWSAISKSLS